MSMNSKVPVGHSVLPILGSNLGSVVAALHCFWMPVIDRGFLDDFLGFFSFAVNFIFIFHVRA